MAEEQTYHASTLRPGPLIGAAVAIVAAAWWWWRPFRVAVDGDSMEPVLRHGDWLLVTRRGFVRRGCIVVVEHPHRPGFELVKRVTAWPGDLAPDGSTLALDRWWVEGDRPERSTDSRAFGPVAGGSIRGIVRFRYSPLSRRRLRYRPGSRVPRAIAWRPPGP